MIDDTVILGLLISAGATWGVTFLIGLIELVFRPPRV